MNRNNLLPVKTTFPKGKVFKQKPNPPSGGIPFNIDYVPKGQFPNKPLDSYLFEKNINK